MGGIFGEGVWGEAVWGEGDETIDFQGGGQFTVHGQVLVSDSLALHGGGQLSVTMTELTLPPPQAFRVVNWLRPAL